MGWAVEAPPSMEVRTPSIAHVPAGHWEEVAAGNFMGDAGGGGTERVWVPNVALPYGQIFENLVVTSFVGVPKGIANGTPKLAMSFISTFSKWSAMAQMQKVGVDPYESGQIANGMVAGWHSGEIVAYNDVREEVGGNYSES